MHLTTNTISAKLQTWSWSKRDLTFFRNIWNFFEQQYNMKFDTLCLMTELVRGMGLLPIWRHKLFCMHVHKELMPCKWVCDVKSRIEPGPCWPGREPIDKKISATFCQFLKPLKIPDTDKIIKFFSLCESCTVSSRPKINLGVRCTLIWSSSFYGFVHSF